MKFDHTTQYFLEVCISGSPNGRKVNKVLIPCTGRVGLDVTIQESCTPDIKLVGTFRVEAVVISTKGEPDVRHETPGAVFEGETREADPYVVMASNPFPYRERTPDGYTEDGRAYWF